jgi:hypothetical protein
MMQFAQAAWVLWYLGWILCDEKCWMIKCVIMLVVSCCCDQKKWVLTSHRNKVSWIFTSLWGMQVRFSCLLEAFWFSRIDLLSWRWLPESEGRFGAPDWCYTLPKVLVTCLLVTHGSLGTSLHISTYLSCTLAKGCCPLYLFHLGRQN